MSTTHYEKNIISIIEDHYFFNQFIYRLIFSLLIISSIHSNSRAQSPYKLDTTKESMIFGSSIELGVIGLKINDDILPFTLNEINALNRDDVNKFDRGATYNWSPTAGSASDILVAATILSPALLSFSDKVRNDFTPVLVMYFQTLILADVLSLTFKGITQRYRPFVYNEDTPLEEKQTQNAKRSFFSGHTSTAFAMVVFLSTVYSDYYPNSEWKPFVWGISLLAASTVGYLRYAASKHYPTDIITGAVVGSALGYFIPFIHRTNESDLDVSIGINGNGSTINFLYKF
ncbi:MAG: phosphatase PAP2 family protein [Bacteroidetes bacterium]|nr:phosphatase PAP2 family protein [Bacteroidota bacterium]MCH7770682.1 phosphatase PAP2 family protein [Bacteroidota bacterium]